MMVPKKICQTLQHTATHCNTLQHTATHCNTLQHTATHCNTLQYASQKCRYQSKSAKAVYAVPALTNVFRIAEFVAAMCCSMLQCAAVCCSVLQRVAVCCSVLQCVAVCCSVLWSNSQTHTSISNVCVRVCVYLCVLGVSR